MRRTFLDFRRSRAPASLGNCASDQPRLAGILNEAMERLVKAGGESGFYGSWLPVIFNVTRSLPYITLPRSIARLINATICSSPIRIQNPFYEFLEYGDGFQPGSCACQLREAYDRGTFPTMKDLDGTGNPKVLRFYITDARDIDKRILVQAEDENGTTLRSLDNGIDVQGVYVRFESPFVDTEFTVRKITGLQKEILVGDLRLYEVDTVTGEQVALSVFEPSEQNPAYRRYYLGGLPSNCCPGQTTVQVRAMAKMEFIPVTVDQDWLVLGNLPALKLACEAVRYSEIDNPQAFQMSKSKWSEAIKVLAQEMDHYMGKHHPAIRFSPFGNDRLECVLAGMI